MARPKNATDESNAMLPGIPKYKHGDLRPNPQSAKGERGDLAYVQGPSLIGDFGDTSASANRTPGLPPTSPPTPKGEPDDQVTGWR